MYALDSSLKNGGVRDQPTTATLLVVPTKEDDGAIFRCEVWNRALRPDKKLVSTVTLSVNFRIVWRGQNRPKLGPTLQNFGQSCKLVMVQPCRNPCMDQDRIAEAGDAMLMYHPVLMYRQHHVGNVGKFRTSSGNSQRKGKIMVDVSATRN
ncbi:hypothetical protein WA026_008606 [Henosepilachna vigintioctopunctata]|uniref:Uncharacterized protein n=1 Tax=Henosepilachna vigintioctopunctata TaxID=420089 RepID=A0AAW1UC26_9CUCU